MPTRTALAAVRSSKMSWPDFRDHIEARVRGQKHAPGELMAIVSGDMRPVEDEDTLCCACSKADAAEGKCHRVVVANVLASVGWRIVLDGEDLAQRLF